MGLPIYLAMTGWEIHACETPRCLAAYMACHFSPYGTGLSGIPQALSPGAALMVNDRIPFCLHDIDLILSQLEGAIRSLSCRMLFLDFQRSGVAQVAEFCHRAAALPCTLVVAEPYASPLSCPVLLPPVPPHTTPEAHLAPWKGRQVWLEIAPESSVAHVTTAGATFRSLPWYAPEKGDFFDDALCCSYRIQTEADAASFFMTRGACELEALCKKAETLGVQGFMGLYQQLYPLKASE